MSTDRRNNETRQFCTFMMDDLYFGIHVIRVQEVIRYQEMTRVPLASPMIRGLINLRGQIVTAVELRSQLNLPPRPPERLPMNVVIRTEEGAVSLLVDDIGDVIEVNEKDYEDAPQSIRRAVGDLVKGIYKLDNRLLLLLDTERALEKAALGHAA